MNSHQFFSPSISSRINICPDDIKQCLDKYMTIKKTSFINPISNMIKALQLFYNNLNPKNALNNEQLYWLANQLYLLWYKKQTSKHTYRACEILYDKMGVLVRYGYADKQLFNQILRCPKLDEYIQSIKKRLPKVNIDPLIISHPDVLEYIAKSKNITKTMLNPDYCALVKDYQYFIPACGAIDRLHFENKIFYHNIQEEKTRCVQESNEKVWNATFRSYIDDKVEITTTSVFHDRSKNPYYKAELDSPENINFIFKHAEHADIIADVLIRLHERMIGKAYQEQAENYMNAMMDKNPEMFLQFSQRFLSNSNIELDSLKRTLSEAQFYQIIQQIIDQSSACIPRRKLG